MNTPPSQPSGCGSGDIFATTHWTVVLAAGDRSTTESQAALETLCRTYWYPLYAYVRRHGRSREDAEDVVQSFFARLLARDFPAKLSSEQGKFRAYLLASLKNFLANDYDRSQAQKRGGGVPHLSLDWQTADTKFELAAGHEMSPDRAFDREWAVALLGRVIERLQQECVAEGRAKLFDQLKLFLTAGRGESAHKDVADVLGMEEGAVRVAVHRLRKRYRQMLREEIAQTLSDPQMIDDEMRALFGAFAV